MKILIAIPCMDTVPAVFTQSLAMLQKIGDCAICMQVGSLVYDARNKLAKQAIEMGADLVFWLDSDMVFEPNVLIDMVGLMQLDNLDILTAVCYRRREPYTPVVFDEVTITDEGCRMSEFKEIPRRGLFEVGACGFGCVLVKTQVLLDVASKFGDMFSPINSTGEDISFCWRARECGYKIMADPSIKIGHYSQQIVTRQFYEAFREAQNESRSNKTIR